MLTNFLRSVGDEPWLTSAPAMHKTLFTPHLWLPVHCHQLRLTNIAGLDVEIELISTNILILANRATSVNWLAACTIVRDAN